LAQVTAVETAIFDRVQALSQAKTAMLNGRLLKDAQAAVRILKFRLAHADCWR
jgi:hypothetical protein